MPIEIDASVPVDNLEGGSQGGRQLLEREGLRRAVTPTVTNISAYVSILSSLIMGRGGGSRGGVSSPGMSPKAVQKSFIIPSSSPLFFPPPPSGAEVDNTLISILSY